MPLLALSSMNLTCCYSYLLIVTHGCKLHSLRATCPSHPRHEKCILQVHLGSRSPTLLVIRLLALAGALKEFEAILSESPGDAVACNNAAICQLYACNLKGGLQQLERGLAGHPGTVLHETVLLNLTSMYNLSSSAASTEAKRKLGAWAAKFAADDIDLTCIVQSS